MNLINLPEEVLIIIIKLLDAQSLHNVYNTCKYLRQVLCFNRAVKKLDIHLSTLATSHTLKSDFFKGISAHLVELNMCGIQNLKKSSLLPVMKKLKCLKTLDISYTNINIVEFIEIYHLCPTIKNISLNFVFGRLGMTTISQGIIKECQNIFKNFDNIHFIGSVCNLLNSALSLYILSDCNLKCLKFSVSESNYVFTTNHPPINLQDLKKTLQFYHCNVCILNWREKNNYYQNVNSIPFLLDLDLRKYEYIITTMLNINNFNVFVSPIFKQFFKENFNIDAEVENELEKPLFGNISIMLWNKNTSMYDNSFYIKLYNKLKNYFPIYCHLDKGPVSSKCDWFYTLPKIDTSKTVHEIFNPHLPKRRMANPSVVLNYDSLFRQQEKLMLSVIFQEYLSNAVTLTSNCDYLRKLTFFSLSGTVRYSVDFFNVLFSSCVNLVTLNVEATSVSPCILPISRNIHLSKSLKNFRIVDRRIDFNTIILSLSKCTSLANIHIVEDTHNETCSLADASILLENCDNLYNLYIEAPMTEREQVKHMRQFTKNINKYRKYHINIVIQPKAVTNRYRYCYDPYLDAFNLSSIKQT